MSRRTCSCYYYPVNLKYHLRVFEQYGINLTRKITSRSFNVLLALVVEALSLVWPAGAADYYVRPPATCTNTELQSPYASWDTAATQIQWAVDVAMTNLPATVWVTNGVYSVTNQVMITNSVVVRSVKGWTNTLVYAAWPAWTTRVFYVVNTGVLDGFTISNGHMFASNNYSGGGGVYASSSSTVQNCYITHNFVSNDGVNAGGGGVYATNATVLNCDFVRNRQYIFGKWGGGAFIGNGGVIDGCRANSNWSYGGAGGIHLYYASKAVNCTAISNYGYHAGGFYVFVGNISNCLSAYNSSQYPGGINIGAGPASVVDCIISNNTAGPVNAGGGIYGGGLTLLNCTIVNNNGGYGGVVTVGTLVSNCVIAGNSGSVGGGIYLYSQTYSPVNVVDSCKISNNIVWSGTGGGGVAITNFGQVRNCLIHHNTNLSAGSGGGVLLGNSSAFTNYTYGLINCTIADNYSTNEGGGISVFGPSNNVVNCIVAGNSSFSGSYPNVYFKDFADANSSNFYYSCVVTTNSSLVSARLGNITNDPVLCASGNYRLTAASPCINAGINQSWMTNSFDLDGKKRVRYGIVDMGAYERIHDATIYNFH